MLTTPTTNNDRADWAASTINHYGELTSMPAAGEDEETMLGDLLCDMMHYCEREGIDFEKKLIGARVNYEHEVQHDAA